MEFNRVVLTITHKFNPIRTSYSLYGQVLNQVYQAKYLQYRSYTIDSRLTFNKCICEKANFALAFIRRYTHFCQK